MPKALNKQQYRKPTRKATHTNHRPNELPKVLINFTLMVALIAISTASTSSAASYDCAKASSRIENVICASTKVSMLDSKLADIYSMVIQQSSNVDAVRLAQRSWLKAVRNQCQDETCLINVYQMRIDALTASLPKETQEAIENAAAEDRADAAELAKKMDEAALARKQADDEAALARKQADDEAALARKQADDEAETKTTEAQPNGESSKNIAKKTELINAVPTLTITAIGAAVAAYAVVLFLRRRTKKSNKHLVKSKVLINSDVKKIPTKEKSEPNVHTKTPITQFAKRLASKARESYLNNRHHIQSIIQFAMRAASNIKETYVNNRHYILSGKDKFQSLTPEKKGIAIVSFIFFIGLVISEIKAPPGKLFDPSVSSSIREEKAHDFVVGEYTTTYKSLDSLKSIHNYTFAENGTYSASTCTAYGEPNERKFVTKEGRWTAREARYSNTGKIYYGIHLDGDMRPEMIIDREDGFVFIFLDERYKMSSGTKDKC